MLKVIEAFSGIGSQAKALRNIGVDYKILKTIDWDINAIIAYDIIHHGKIDLKLVENYSVNEIKEILNGYTLSADGKSPLTKKQINRLNNNLAKNLLAAILRSENLVSITDVKGNDLPNDIDLLTYSFPCQDLSIARAWHGENGGIDRHANNRSGMLWEVERILKERISNKQELPKFLLMENVTNILGQTHINNFNDWQRSLNNMGYYNHIYKLNAEAFGIPQKRNRVYMISVLANENEREKVSKYLEKNNLSNSKFVKSLKREHIGLNKVLKLDYENYYYKKEADENNPNDTISRRKIFNENILIYNGKDVTCNSIGTITTKQDRNPNSGVIVYENKNKEKSKFRYLTPRECFILMGFSEEDFQILIDNNFNINNKTKFFRTSTLHKMAGNSIVVNVLEEIFHQIIYIKENILDKRKNIVFDIDNIRIKVNE